MTTIIFAHPWHGSFNKVILDEVVKNLEQSKKEYTVIDLYQDGFHPALSSEELALFSKGISQDPLVEKYQHILKETDTLVFIFPIWWAGTPAIIKGFIDKIMLKGYAYEEGKFGLKGLLTNIKKTVIITTSNSPKWYLKWFNGNAIQGLFINKNLKSLGIKGGKWYHCSHTKKESLNKRLQFLHKISKLSLSR